MRFLLAGASCIAEPAGAAEEKGRNVAALAVPLDVVAGLLVNEYDEKR